MIKIYKQYWRESTDYPEDLQKNEEKTVLIHKQCPKCHGNIYLSADYYGRYEQCLQCGYINDLNSTDEHKKSAAQVKEKSLA